MKFRTLITLLLLVALIGIGAAPQPLAAANNLPLVQTATIPMLPGISEPISFAEGNQTNPHVACGITSYTNDDFQGSSTIRYRDSATNTEHVVPGNNLDRLSDTDGRRIAFTEIGTLADQIRLYDIASQSITSIPGDRNFDPAIGGNLVAFVHGFDPANGFEIQVYDQNTGNVTQLTTDGLRNWVPEVSPDGSVVVWDKCQVNDTGCDVYAATQTGPGAFTTRLVTGPGDDRSPDTNGQIIVYISDKSGENDIYFQRIGGSTEMHLAIPGDQREVHISGDLLSFESQTITGYDIFLYDLRSARLYQVTDTPGVDETLDDVVAGCGGVNRIVYAKPGPWGDFDVWGFSFQLSDSTTDQLNDLIALVQSFNLPAGTANSLITKLQDARNALSSSDTATACASLTAFINASQAQLGKKLTADQVRQLIDSAAEIKSDLGCQ